MSLRGGISFFLLADIAKQVRNSSRMDFLEPGVSISNKDKERHFLSLILSFLCNS